MYHPRLFWNKSAKRFTTSRNGLEAIGIPEGGYINNYLDHITRKAVFNAWKRINIVGSTVLDIGCGIGRLTIHYAKNARYVIGLDISEEMIKIAKERTKPFGHKLEYIVASCHAMPFKEDTFDIVNCVAVLQHIEDDKLFDKSIQEIGRILTNHAAAILVETAPLRINAPEKRFSQSDSPTFPRSPTYFFSQLEPNNLSLICKRGVNTSLFIGSFLKLASIFKAQLGRPVTSHLAKTGFIVLKWAFNVMLMFLTLLSITVDTIISRIEPALLYKHSEYKMFLLSKIDKTV